jgi:hypothetical protein
LRTPTPATISRDFKAAGIVLPKNIRSAQA